MVTDTEGNALAMPDNVRVFLLASLEHAAQANARSAPVADCTYSSNPLYAGPSLRALLVALDEWISKGTPAPASRYPSRADGTLVPPTERGRLSANSGPRLHRPCHTDANALDHAATPPARGKEYPVFVPRTDADGNAIAGIRLPTLAAPVGTHLGWNVRKAGFSQGALCGNNGAMLPFARTRDERIKANDPRPSLAERYPNAGDRAALIEKAARQLVRTGCCWRRTSRASCRRRIEVRRPRLAPHLRLIHRRQQPLDEPSIAGRSIQRTTATRSLSGST